MNRRSILLLSLMLSLFAVAGEMSAYIPPPPCVADPVNPCRVDAIAGQTPAYIPPPPCVADPVNPCRLGQ